MPSKFPIKIVSSPLHNADAVSAQLIQHLQRRLQPDFGQQSRMISRLHIQPVPEHARNGRINHYFEIPPEMAPDFDQARLWAAFEGFRFPASGAIIHNYLHAGRLGDRIVFFFRVSYPTDGYYFNRPH